jgi:ATP-dependent DNA ligase
VIWNGDRLAFDLLQQRLVTGASTLPALAARHPATFMVFDVLAVEGADLRSRPLRQRREVLEELTVGWRPPLQLTPSTSDEETARGWFVDYRVAGVEGLVVKAAGSRYSPGRRSWVKVKSRESTEVIVGAVTGSLARPETVVGKTTPLSRTQAAELAAALTPAGSGHPWPDQVASTRFGSSRERVTLVKVEPVLVAEVLADAALDSGGYRHPLRYLQAAPRPLPGRRATLTPAAGRPRSTCCRERCAPRVIRAQGLRTVRRPEPPSVMGHGPALIRVSTVRGRVHGAVGVPLPAWVAGRAGSWRR